MLRIENVSKAYRKTDVLKELTMDFPATGLHLITGVNGAGKTTLFKCIAGLESYRGSITWDGQKTGFVSAAFDDSPAHDALTGLQNLSAVLDRPIKELKADPSVRQFLTMDRLEKKTRAYSFGQRKKLSLTAVFLDTRPCIPLDEPTSGLDAPGRELLLDMLAASARARCVIVSDHDIGFYAGLSPTVYLEDGSVHTTRNGSEATIGGVDLK